MLSEKDNFVGENKNFQMKMKNLKNENNKDSQSSPNRNKNKIKKSNFEFFNSNNEVYFMLLTQSIVLEELLIENKKNYAK